MFSEIHWENWELTLLHGKAWWRLYNWSFHHQNVGFNWEISKQKYGDLTIMNGELTG